MARPVKWRRICHVPKNNEFGPLTDKSSSNGIVKMTVDEYETIRLIDCEGLNQEECATRMNIARTTVQGIYNNARKKLADSIINSKILIIEGGNYEICNGRSLVCDHRYCEDED